MEEILYNKHKEVEECENFIKFIEQYFLNFNEPASNSNILINLLNQKVKILNSLDYQNCKNLVLSFEKLDDEIYNQIEILKSEINQDTKKFTYDKKIKYNVSNINKYLKKDKNSITPKIIKEFLLKNEHFEKYVYKKSIKVKKEAFFDIFNFIKNHQWISTLLFFSFGFVIYILFFFFQGYIPAISQSELLYQIIQSSGIFLLIPCLIISLVFWYSSIYINDRQNGNFDNKIFKYFSKSLFVNLTSYIAASLSIWLVLQIFPLEIYKLLVWFFYLFEKYLFEIRQEFFIPFFTLLIIFIAFLLFNFLLSKVVKSQKFQIVFYILLLVIYTSMAIYVLFITNSLFKVPFILFMFVSIVLFWKLRIDNERNKKEYLYLVCFSTTLMMFSVPVFFSDYIYKTLNISGVEYKYIVLDKKADEFLPDDMICKFNCDKEVEIISYINSNLTYKTDNGSKIRNLKDKDCLTFVDDNNKTINTDNKKFTFKDGNLTFTEKKNNTKENNTIQNVKASFNNKSCLAYAKYKNDSIVLYNIEAISTLGKYWYIKTKFDDKFELQSDFIKTKVKK